MSSKLLSYLSLFSRSHTRLSSQNVLSIVHRASAHSLRELRDYCTPMMPSSTQKPEDSDTYMATVALVGAANAGKSSLSNAIIQNRVSAVSRKVNTTRSCTAGVYTRENRQLLLWDTPGLVERAFIPTLGAERRTLCTEGWGAAVDADVAVFVIDTSRGFGYWRHFARVAGELVAIRRKVANSTSEEGSPQSAGHCVLVLNKVDVTRPRTRLIRAAEYFKSEIPGFEQQFIDRVFYTSAYRGDGVPELRETLLGLATPGKFEAPPDVSYFDDEIDVIQQHVWEKLLHRVHREVPYRCQFEVDDFQRLSNDSLFASIIIRAPTKATAMMIVGPKGNTLAWMRDEAVKSVSQILGYPVKLKLSVKVAKK